MANVIVVGGGSSGMMAALTAAKNNHNVTLIERNEELGKKLKVTGGGRCNITNNRDIEDLYRRFYTFTNRDLLNYFDKNDLEYKVEDFNDHKVYTKSDKSIEVIETFKNDLLKSNVKILYNKKVTDLLVKDDTIFKNDLLKSNVKILYNKKVTDLLVKDDTIYGVVLENGEKIYSDKVIISTGGKSHSHTGSDGMMYDILRKYNHTITKIYPALSPLNIKEGWIKNLQGISMQKVEISCKIKKKKISKIGDMIFTHFGLSGPCVLIISSYINKALEDGEVEINIDFLPTISSDEISKIIRGNPNKNILNNLKEILPQNFIKEILSILNLNDKKANELAKSDELKVIEYIKNMKLTCNGTKGIKVAQVTSGGVSVKEINSSTMESKLINNLFFTGEVIDVDAQTGGYNLQIAFSTGYLAGISV